MPIRHARLLVVLALLAGAWPPAVAGENSQGPGRGQGQGRGRAATPEKAGEKGATKGSILMVIAPEEFRDEELFTPKAMFEKAGYEVRVAGKAPGEVKGMLGGTAKAEAALSQVKAADYQAVIFVGGSGASAYFRDEEALALAKSAGEDCPVVGAICIAPVILANAGMLRGKQATVWKGQAGALKRAGAIYTGRPVATSGKIVTGNGPEAAETFAKTVLMALEKAREAEQKR